MLTPVPPTDCMHAREAASARLDGELSELETAQLDGHLHVCDSCSAYAREIAAVAAELRADPLEMPVFPVFTARRRPLVRARVAAAAATIAAATASSFAIGQMLGSHGSSPPAVDTTLVFPEQQAHHVLGMLRTPRPGRLPVGSVIAV